jgi:hypothetical protein
LTYFARTFSEKSGELDGRVSTFATWRRLGEPPTPIATLPKRKPTRTKHPLLQVLSSVQNFANRLLHADRAEQCMAGARERDHEPPTVRVDPTVQAISTNGAFASLKPSCDSTPPISTRWKPTS